MSDLVSIKLRDGRGANVCKPRLVREWWLNEDGRLWLCQSREVKALGITPAEAYGRWLKKILDNHLFDLN